MERNVVIGIDLGTTNTCVAIAYTNQVGIKCYESIKSEAEATVPSMVSFEGNHVYIGKSAKFLAVENSENTIYGSKRAIGQKYKSVVSFYKGAPFKIIEDQETKDVRFCVKIEGSVVNVSPEEITMYLMSNVVDMVKNRQGNDINIHAVITVPALFDGNKRNIIKRAAEKAGIHVLKLIAEPIAAAFCYKNAAMIDHGNIFVFDFGGGTLDTSIVKVDDNNFQVLSVDGNPMLGGTDIDNCVIDYVASELKSMYGIDVLNNPKMLSELRTQCETAKKVFNSDSIVKTVITISNMYSVELDKNTFNEIIEPLTDQLDDPIARTLEGIELEADDITDYIMTGGSSRLPIVSEILSSTFNRQPKTGVNPEEAIAVGAAIAADEIFSGKDLNIRYTDINTIPIGVRNGKDDFLKYFDVGVKLPAIATKTFSTKSGKSLVKVRLYQGYSNKCSENVRLETLKIKVPSKSKFSLTIELTTEGLIKVAATLDDGRKNEVMLDMERDWLEGEELRKALARHARLMERRGAVNELHKAINSAETRLNSLPSDDPRREIWSQTINEISSVQILTAADAVPLVSKLDDLK